MRCAIPVLLTLLLSCPARAFPACANQEHGGSPDGGPRLPDSARMQQVYEEVRTPYKYGIVLRGAPGTLVDCPSVFRRGDSWYMVYISMDTTGYETHLARSSDLLHWTPLGVILPFSGAGHWDAKQAAGFIALQDHRWGGSAELQRYDGHYWMSYLGGALAGYETDPLAIGIAWTDTPGRPRPWHRLPRPVLSRDQPDCRSWEKLTQYKSTIIWDRDQTLGAPFVMYYNAKAVTGYERIGMAVSDDMKQWRRYGTDPVIDNGRGISGDPQVVRMGDLWVMFYFGYAWKPRAFDTFACSYDLVHWSRWNGPHLVEPGEPWDQKFAHKPWMIKHDGVVYHFYCAVGDQGRVIALATSKDLGAQAMHRVAVDDCGNDGSQRHRVTGMNWTFTKEEMPVSILPEDSPLRSVAFGGGVLYRFRGLKSSARYQLRASFITDRAVREELCTVDDTLLADTVRLIPSAPVVRTYDIPPSAAADGQIDVEFRLLKGPNAVVSFLELLSDDPALEPVPLIALASDLAGRISGTVTDENTGLPAVGARVRGVLPPFPRIGTMTDDSGRFSLRIPEAWKRSVSEACVLEATVGSARGQTLLSLFEVYPEKHPLLPAPDSLPGVRRCRISLNGQWSFCLRPQHEFWNEEGDTSTWSPINVPGEARMQGFPLEHDRECAYRRTIAIPAELKDGRLMVRFHGVYSAARVWLNGAYVRSHHGGFTSWDADITSLVKPGSEATLTVGVTDRADEISFGSGYAKHPIGGILRGVELLLVPKTSVRQLALTTSLDSGYLNATLKVESALSAPADATLELRLADPAGRPVPIAPSAMKFRGAGASTVRVPVRGVQLWDAEHPRLYTLEARLVTDGRTQEIIRRRVGFREVRVEGRALLVNGHPVKLRGACRHDIHPVQGRSTTPAQDRQDALLAREANFNFIRTSHYPPSEEFLSACDEVGIYVEEESAVCFVSTFRGGIYAATGGSQSDPLFTQRYLAQLAEMIDRDRNHPGVIIWSIGNENTYGSNFQKEYAYAKAVDPSRPVMFSFPHTVPRGVTVYDIYSSHYPAYDRCLNLPAADRIITVPVLGDEWMHVPCYCLQDLRSDPNIRNFWGESIKRAWENTINCEESLGGAIWGMIDETFLLPDSIEGYGQWGIVDVWRRKKPEFWHTRKAYSPVRLLATSLKGEPAGEGISLPVENRFDQTNLNELRALCSAGPLSREVPLPDVPPHARGTLRLPPELDNGLPIHLRFVDGPGRVIDEEMVTPARESSGSAGTGLSGGKGAERPEKRLVTSVAGDSILVKGGFFSVTFDRATGLIRSGISGGTRTIEGGPYIHLVTRGRSLSWDVDSLTDRGAGLWHCDSLGYHSTDSIFVLALRGTSGVVRTRLTMDLRSSGQMTVSYQILDPHLVDTADQSQEMGIAFLLDRSLDRLSWSRKALWSVYPEDHIGRAKGEAVLLPPGSAAPRYRARPDGPWSQDTHDFFLFKTTGGVAPDASPATNDFRGTKERIERYTLLGSTGWGLQVEANGDMAARTSVRRDGRLDLFINTHWSYLNLNWGNYERPAAWKQPGAGRVTVRFIAPGSHEQ